MLVPRMRPVCVSLGGVLHTCGGEYDGDITCSVERLDADGWQELSPMSYNRQGAAAAVLDRTIYVCGGFDGTVDQTSAERFCAAAGTWEELPPMREGRHGAIAAPLGGCLLVCGGFNGGHFSGSERFEPIAGTWTSLAPMTIRRRGAAGAAIGGQLCVFGGQNGFSNTLLRTCECLDSETGRWESIFALPEGRRLLAAASLPS